MRDAVSSQSIVADLTDLRTVLEMSDDTLVESVHVHSIQNRHYIIITEIRNPQQSLGCLVFDGARLFLVVFRNEVLLVGMTNVIASNKLPARPGEKNQSEAGQQSNQVLHVLPTTKATVSQVHG